MKSVKFIYIGGAGRSGTTLIQKVLLSHPAIAGGPEFYFTAPYFKFRAQLINKFSSKAFHPSFSQEDIKEKTLEFYHSFFEPYLQEGISYIAEKTPTNIEVIQDLLNADQEAVFVNVYRDGRAVLNSHLQVKKRAKKSKNKNLTEINTFSTSIYWSKCIQMGKHLPENIKPRVFSIQYEALLKNPIEVFGQLFNFLNLDLPAGAVDPSEIKSDESARKAHVNDVWYTEEMYGKSYDSSRIEQWKGELSFIKRGIASGLMYPELKALGYDVSAFHQFTHAFLFFFIDFKSIVKRYAIFKPFLYLKRSMQ